MTSIEAVQESGWSIAVGKHLQSLLLLQDILCSVVDSTMGELRQNFSQAIDEYWKKREVYHMQMAIEEVKLMLLPSFSEPAAAAAVTRHARISGQLCRCAWTFCAPPTRQQ